MRKGGLLFLLSVLSVGKLGGLLLAIDVDT
jgi:hypothetical protein